MNAGISSSVEIADENLSAAIKVLGKRVFGPSDHPDGRLRMGNVFSLARAAGCHEVVCQMREALEDRSIPWGSVEDEPVREFKFLLTPSQVRGINSFNDELGVTIELARVAGFKEEADWIAQVWGM